MLTFAQIFLQGNVDNDLALSGRFNYRISKALTAKASLNLVPGAAANQSQIVLESDYTGDDFSATVRAVNPSILDFDNKLTGMFIGSYLQSVTPRLALGIETMYQRLSDEDGPQTVQSYVARYKGNQWIGSAALLNGGMLQGSYWRRLSEKVEAGLDINLSLLGLAAAGSGAGMMGGARNEGSATMGAKYDFRTSVFRGQIDSQGKVSAVLEKRIAPMVQFTFAGEMDHSKVRSLLPPPRVETGRYSSRSSKKAKLTIVPYRTPRESAWPCKSKAPAPRNSWRCKKEHKQARVLHHSPMSLPFR